jgi:restriction system protein
MDTLLFLVVLISAGVIYYLRKQHQKTIDQFRTMVIDVLNCNDEMKETLLVGLHQRYKDRPLDFEDFAAQAFAKYFNASDFFVTSASHDFGVDFELDCEDGKYLGQVKCYDFENKVDYKPIAIIHSQMEKQGAKKGFVITTSDFTGDAISYWKGIKDFDIELIDGIKLVEYWVKGMEQKKEVLVPNTVAEM